MSSKRRKQAKSSKRAEKPQSPQVNSILPRPAQNLYLVLFLVNVILAFGWQLVVPLFGNFGYLIGFAVGFVAITLFHRPYGWRAYRLIHFAGYVLWQIVLSNLSIAKLVLQANPKLDPAIIAVPLTVSSGLEITILASVITLTPGTISVDLGQNQAGQRVLYVHNLRAGDPETFRRSIQQGFERRLLEVTRGTAA